MHDGATNGAAFLVAMKAERLVGLTGQKLVLFNEVVVGGKDIRAVR